MTGERSQKPECPGTRALLENTGFMGGNVFFLGWQGTWRTRVGWGLLVSVRPREGAVEQLEGLFTKIPNPPLEVLFQTQ